MNDGARGSTTDSTGPSAGNAIAFYAAISAVVALVGIGSVFLPMGADQGNYAYAAWAWLEGQVPYRDVLVFKPPLTLFFYGLAHQLGGHSGLGIRVIDLVWQVATAGLLAAFTYRWTRSRMAGAAAACLYALSYYQFGFWHTAQTEGWVTLPILAALLATSRAVDKNDWRPMVLAGVGIGFATGLKYPLIAGALPVAVLVGIRLPGREWWAMGAAFAAGGLAVAMAIVGWLVGIGAWEAFVDHHLNILPGYAEYSLHGRTLYGLGAIFVYPYVSGRMVVMAVCLGAGLLTYLLWGLERWRRNNRSAQFDAIWAFRLAVLGLLAAGAVSTFSQGKYFEYQYLPWIAPAAIMGGEVFSASVARLARPFASVILAAIVILVGSITHVSTLTRDWIDLAAGDRTMAEHWRSTRFIGPNHSVRDSYDLSRWLEEQTSPDDRVFVWGRDPSINYLAARRAPSRFIYNYPFRFPWVGPGLEVELLTDLKRSAPEIVVVASRDATLRASGSPKDSRELLQDYDELRGWIERNYRRTSVVGAFEVLRKRD